MAALKDCGMLLLQSARTLREDATQQTAGAPRADAMQRPEIHGKALNMSPVLAQRSEPMCQQCHCAVRTLASCFLAPAKVEERFS
eukprot:3540397-Pyramimonas_sp.AAC.1